MGDSPDNPAFQLFHLELQELLEQIGLALTALVDSHSPSDYKRLCRSVRLIHQGAVQMKLEFMEQRTTEFLKILLPVSNLPEGDLSPAQLETLTQLFRELQTLEIAPSKSLPEFSAVDHLSADSMLLELSQSASGGANDIRQVLLQNEIATVIAQLEHSLGQLTGDLIIADLKVKLDALVGWGEVLDWPELVTLAKAIALGVEAHVTAAPAIASVGLLGLQSLYQSALSQGQTLAQGHLPSPEPSPPDDGMSPSRESFVFETARKFIWQSQQVIFVLDSTAIAETLIPQQTQVTFRGEQRLLEWHRQRLPMVSLTRLLQQKWIPALGLNPVEGMAETVSSLGPVIVISSPLGMMAIEVEMEQFIRTPELKVSPLAAAPAFYLGRTSVPDHSDLHLIDVLELLAMSLPPTAVKLNAEGTEGIDPQEPDDAEVLPGAPVSPSTSVLVVDDSRTIRYLIRRTFEQSNYAVILAQDGLEAIQKLQQHPEISLMVSDVEMPNLNGFELLSRCRRQPDWKDLPIIILSQCSTDQHRQLALQFGADAYVSKPYDEDEFLVTVSSVLRE